MQFLHRMNPFQADEYEDATDGRPQFDLHNAALWNDITKIKKLIADDTDINELTIGGKETALMWAAQEGHTEAVILLLENGARTSLQNEAGLTAADLAKRQGHAETAQVPVNPLSFNPCAVPLSILFARLNPAPAPALTSGPPSTPASATASAWRQPLPSHSCSSSLPTYPPTLPTHLHYLPYLHYLPCLPCLPYLPYLQ